jgi:hypothetical protein
VTRRRRGLAGLALAAVAATAGCLDALVPGAPRALARLGIVPVFDEVGSRDGIPADVDSIHVTIRHPGSPDIVVGLRIAPGQDSIVIAVEVPLANGVADTVTMGFSAIRSSDGAVLYEGSQDCAVRVGVLSQADSVRVRYVGPGQNLQSISIAPDAVALHPGDSATFSVLSIDSTGATIVGMPVLYQSRNTDVATVAQPTEVHPATARGVAEGWTYVIATAGARASVRDSALVMVSTSGVAVMELSATAVTFTDTIGTGDPAVQTIAVSNTGNGTLTGLAVGTISYGTGPTGWLTVTLEGATAPATLTLAAAKGSLAAGTYTATVPVTSSVASNSPRNVTVTFDLRRPPVSLASIQATPGFRVMLPADTVRLQVTGKDAAGSATTPTGVRFASRAPGVARVDSVTGLVTGIAAGTAVVVVSATGASGPVLDSLLVAVPASGQAVAFAITNGHSFATARVGDSLPIVIGVDLRAVPGEKLGSYNAQLDWAPSVAAFEVIGALAVNGFVAPTVNTSNAASGQLRFGAADPAGSAAQPIGLAAIRLRAAASGSSALTFTLTDLSAAITFTNLLTRAPAALVVSGTVRVQ